MSPYRAKIRACAVAVLTDQIPDVRILVGQHWPVEIGQLPALLVDMRAEDKRSNSIGEPAFDVTSTMVIRAREVIVSDPEQAAYGAAHGPAIEKALDRWIEEIQSALLQAPEFVSMVTSIPTVRVETQVSTETEDLVAEAGVTFTLAYQERWQPRVTNQLARVRLGVDAIDPQDPSGNYVPPAPFPAPKPPPRDRGPDGRLEIGADIIIPTT
nr:hypothetical protein [uncultured Roseococcus sp.]